MKMPLSKQQWLPVAAALAEFWSDYDGLSGPTKANTKSRLGLVGVSYDNLVGNRQERVFSAVEKAGPVEVEKIVTELAELVREAGFFDRNDSGTTSRIGKLQTVLSHVGGELADDGSLTWKAKAADGEEILRPQAPAIVPPLSGALGNIQSQGITGPTVDFLLTMLRKIPHASWPLTVNRRNTKALVTINDEYDAQDFIHMALRMLYEDVRPEEPTPSYGGSSSRTDFFIKQEKVVVEAKVVHKKQDATKVAKQLNDDILRYLALKPDLTDLICVVYDLDGSMGNRKGFEDAFVDVNGLKVHVVAELWPHTERSKTPEKTSESDPE